MPEKGTSPTTTEFTGEEIAGLRNETPGCREVIHLNNAGAALMPDPVVDAIHAHIDLEARIGGYEAAEIRAPAIAHVYEAVASLLNTDGRNIALVENATVAYSQALASIPWREGDTIVTTNCDYVSNQMMFLSLHKRFGVRLMRAPDHAEGGVDVSAMEKLIAKHSPRLVAVTHVPTNSGLIQDVEAIGRLCRDRGTLYLVDACQSAGQLSLDVAALRCDFLTASSRKFLRGPRGTGFLYVSDRVLEEGYEPLFPDLRGAEWAEADEYIPYPTARRFENFEYAFANVLGMGEAVSYALALGLDRIERRVATLADLCRRRLKELPGIRVLDRGPRLCGIVTAKAGDRDVGALVDALRHRSINTSKSPRNFALIDFDRKGVEEGALRISPHYYNVEEDIDAFAASLRELLSA